LGEEHAVVALDFEMFQEIKDEILSGDLSKIVKKLEGTTASKTVIVTSLG